MMRKVLFISLLCLISFLGYSQNDTTKYFKNVDYGWNYRKLKAREAFILPSDTVYNKLGLACLNNVLYTGDGIKWKVSIPTQTTPSLQAVTNEGRTTSNGNFIVGLNDYNSGNEENLILNGYNPDKPEMIAKIGLNINNMNCFFRLGDSSIYTYGLGYVEITPDNITLSNHNNASTYTNNIAVPINNNSNFTNTLPLANGTFVTSINNNTADAFGNINIPSDNNKLNISDTANMLSPYLRKVDTTNKWVNSIYRKSGKDSIYFNIGANQYAIKDSINSTSGFVPYTGATQDVNLGGNQLTAYNLNSYNSYANSVEADGLFTLRNGAGQSVLISMDYFNESSINKGRIKLMGNGSYSIITSKATANRDNYFPDSSGTIALKEYTVNNIYRKSGIDSIYFKINSTEYAIKDSTSNVSGFVPYTGATTDVDLGTHILNAQSIGIKGTNGNGHIDLRHQASDATATGQTTALFANSNGDLKWKNAGNYYTTLATQQTADRVYTFQNKSYTLADSTDVTNRLKYTDTSTMLTNYAKTSAVNLKVNISDTASMLTPYAKTSSLSSYLLKSDSSIFYPIYRSDSSRTNIYNALNGKQSSLTFSTGLTNTSGTITNNLLVGVSGGQTIIGGTAASNNLTLSTTSNATKGKIIFGTSSAYDQVNDRIGVGTTSPANKLDVIRGTAGTMARNAYESGSYSYDGDMKVGVYTSSTNSAHGAAISFGQTNLLTNSRYAGFDMQYVYSATVANNAWRLNYTERSSAGLVQNYTANIFQAYADGSVIINPTTSGVTASAKLLIGTATNAGYMLDVNGTARATQFYLSALNTAPASATATGTTGEIRIDANYIYICTATNTWKRVAISTW